MEIDEMEFTKRRFLELTAESQHKKCAEILRLLYEQQGEMDLSLLKLYHQFLEWMQVSAGPLITLKEIADRFHWHAQLAGVSFREHRLLPKIRTGDRTTGAEPWPIAIYFDHIRSAYNVGSIIRTTEAFSLGRLYFSKDTPPPTHKQVKDAAMGTEEWVPYQLVESFEGLPRPMIALETAEGAIPLHEFAFPDSFTLILGNEEYGCSDEALAVADYLVEIPLRGRKNSLNVANAYSIAAFEIVRQRQLGKVDIMD